MIGSQNSLRSSLKQKRLANFSNPIPAFADQATDFHNPFSELSLFLSQAIKEELPALNFPKKWSHRIEENLIRAISPQFRLQFPQYRLGVSALRKCFEKIIYYTEQFEGIKEAYTQDGKLNIPFLIRENLKQLQSYRPSPYLPPYLQASQIALKISECQATVDGSRPNIDHLNKAIWALTRHLIPGLSLEQLKSPYEEQDPVDKLIIKLILEITAKEPQIAQEQLEKSVKESILAFYEQPFFSSLDRSTSAISALLAEKLYPSSRFHAFFSAQQKEAIVRFVKRHIASFKNHSEFLSHPDQVRRIWALYLLARQLPKEISEEQIKEAARSLYPIRKEKRPSLPQALYAFISAELLFMRTEQFCRSIDYVEETVASAYKEAIQLPEIDEHSSELLEMIIWKQINASDGILEKLPYQIGQKIEEEIANHFIEQPDLNFSALTSSTTKFFKKIHDLIQHKRESEIERKIQKWSHQSDMLCRWIRIEKTALLKLVMQHRMLGEEKGENRDRMINQVSQEYLAKFPHLGIYAPQLALRIRTLYKYCWYTHFDKQEKSSFERFLDWHRSLLYSTSPLASETEIEEQLQAICCARLPLIPYPRAEKSASL